MMILALITIMTIASASYQCNTTANFDEEGVAGKIEIFFNDTNSSLNLSDCGQIDFDLDAIQNDTVYFNLTTEVTTAPNLMSYNLCSPPQTSGINEATVCLKGDYYEGSKSAFNYNGVQLFDGENEQQPTMDIIVNSTLRDKTIEDLTDGIATMNAFKDKVADLENQLGEEKGKYDSLSAEYQTLTEDYEQVKKERDARADGFGQILLVIFGIILGVGLFVFITFLRNRQEEYENVGDDYTTMDEYEFEE